MASESPSPIKKADKSSGFPMDNKWQGDKATVRERNAFMLNNEFLADVHFVVGETPNQETIPAHKYVLATGSSVFCAMLYGGLTKQEDVINVPDIEPAAFMALLRFVIIFRKVFFSAITSSIKNANNVVHYPCQCSKKIHF